MPQNWTPKSKVAKAVYITGFLYDPEQDIIYSRMDALQRKFGYAYVYDLAAPETISAIIDCEPFFFRYDKKDWMIELWKGHYGLETGCEAGVYVHKHPLLDPILGSRPHDKENGKFFDCANDKERLLMSLTLKRNGEPLFTRGPEVHWWLTGFKWGVLSKVEELTMDLSITFPAAEMRKAFVTALENMGYNSIKTEEEKVSFTFNKPASFQPRLDPKNKTLIDAVQKNNAQIVANYKKLNLSNNDPNQIPDEMADEIIAYFNSFKPEKMKEGITKILKDMNYFSQHTSDTIEELFKEKTGIMKKIKTGLSKVFKKLFG